MHLVSFSNVYNKELSLKGIIHLVTFIQEDIPQAMALDGYYHSHPPSPADRKDIIQ